MDPILAHFGRYLSDSQIRQLEIDIMSDVYGIVKDGLVAVKVQGASIPKVCRVIEELNEDFVFEAIMPSRRNAYIVSLKVIDTENDDYVGCQIVGITKFVPNVPTKKGGENK